MNQEAAQHLKIKAEPSHYYRDLGIVEIQLFPKQRPVRGFWKLKENE